MHRDTLDKIQDAARGEACHARVAREWGTETGRSVRALVEQLLDTLPIGNTAVKDARVILLETIMDLPTAGGIDADAYFDALTEAGR